MFDAKDLTQNEKDILFGNYPRQNNVDYDRKTIERYSQNIRGSVRLFLGRYYTEEERALRAKKIFSVKV